MEQQQSAEIQVSNDNNVVKDPPQQQQTPTPTPTPTNTIPPIPTQTPTPTQTPSQILTQTPTKESSNSNKMEIFENLPPQIARNTPKSSTEPSPTLSPNLWPKCLPPFLLSKLPAPPKTSTPSPPPQIPPSPPKEPSESSSKKKKKGRKRSPPTTLESAPKRRRKSGEVALANQLASLTHPQLLQVVTQLLEDHPELVSEVSSLVPEPDLVSIKNEISELQRAYLKAFPNVKHGSNRDDFAYKRVKVPLIQFKKTVIDYGVLFKKNKQWKVALQYADQIALPAINKMPNWEKDKNNTSKRAALKSLATLVKTAIRELYLPVEDLEHWQTQLQNHEELQPALEEVNNKLEKLKTT